MSSGSNTPEGSLVEILSILESETTGKTERHEAYEKFTRLFKENEVSLFDMDVVKNISRILTVVKKDILTTPDVSQCALQVLGVCLHDSEIVRSMSMQESEDILQSLLDCIFKTAEKGTCTRALWCIGKQNLPVEAVTKKAADISEAVEYSVDKFGTLSVTVEHESINTIGRLAEQCPKELSAESCVWGKVLLPMVVNSAIKVRERALNVIESTLSLMKLHRKETVTSVMPVFKSKVFPELKKLFENKHEMFVLRCWGSVVQLFGEELHHGSYINHVLPVVELGFKNQSTDVKIAAFTAWQQLIDNFATNTNVLGDPKRIKLVMQVFKLNNAKLENIAVVKLKVWWHFVWLLGNKITANFDMVASPLLHYCLGGSKGSDQNVSTPRGILPNGASPKTPQMNLTSTTSNYPVFPVLQQFGCEALAHFLGSTLPDGSSPQHDFKLDHLRQDVITGPSFFIKQSSLLITTATELFINLGKDVPESLLIHIWNWLIIHLKNAIESPIKLDIRETLNALLTRFQVVVLSRVLSSQTLLKMFQSLCQLPEKVLSSSAYSVGGNEMINGTPALFLAGLLLTPGLLQAYSGQESYHTLFKTIVGCGVGNSSGTLRFLQSLLELVSSNGRCIEDQEMVWRLWSAVVNPLLEHITKTNEVNQGDSLEPNFDCCVLGLTLPVELKLASMAQSTVKTLVKTWIELYKTVSRLAAMVTNASANIICEDVCQKMLDLNKDREMEAEGVDLQVQFSLVMTSCLDFSSIGSSSSFNLAAAVYSPKKSIKRKNHPLGNIQSLVSLLCKLHNHVMALVRESEQKKFGVSLQSMLNNLVDIYSNIFTHVNSSSIIGHLIGQLAQPIGMLYSDASKKSVVKLYNNPFQQKLEKLWMDVSTCLQSRYRGLYDSEFLTQVSPLFEATFLHSRRQIKNQTVVLWTSTFANVSSLVYPETLRPVLMKVKEKSVIHLPGWVNTDTPVIEETPLSQMSQSQYPEPRIPGMPSPHKIHGSFLNKAVSPKVIKSPMKAPVTTRAANSVKKKVFKGFDVSNDADFVVIKSSPKKKMVLTEHQREMMKERKVLPAMYNNLELSMDASLMGSHFTTDTQSQMGSCDSTPTPTTEKLPFSLFGSSLNGKTDDTVNEKVDDKDKKDEPPITSDIPSTRCSTRRKTKDAEKEASGMKSPDTDSESGVGRRRSTLSRKQSKETKGPNSGKEESEKPKLSKTRSSDKTGDFVKGKVENVEGAKQENDKVTLQKEASVIVIDESEPMDVETSQLILQQKDDMKEEIDLTKDTQETQRTESGGTSSSNSVPQNLLGAILPTPPSELSSDSSAKDDDGNKQTINTLQPSLKCGQGFADVAETIEKDLPASEPLLSWAQKLEELSQSPGLKKSPFKKSLSQDSKSPSKRGKSPSKSPSKKFFKENLSMQGALDKWIIRSPTKGVPVNLVQNKDSEIIVQSVLSGTFVEETQSPTKFNKKDKEQSDKTNSPSVMETPTKNILEELDVNHSHSNRKLFSSQGSNQAVDMVEDSNMVPASPTSISFTVRTGTPIVKMKKLSDFEIKQYSPNNKLKEGTNLTPSKESQTDSAVKRAKCVVSFSDKIIEDESSHEHDDFSDLKPLENNDTEVNDFSKSLTSTDKVMLEVEDKEKTEKEEAAPDKPQVPDSPTLFSQLNEQRDDLMQQVEHTQQMQLMDSDEMVTEVLGSQGFQTDSQSTPDVNGASQEKSDKSDNMLLEKETPRRGRKRKQITPKKLTPEDAKQQKKKAKQDVKKETPKITPRKVSNRLKERKEKQLLDNSQDSNGEDKPAVNESDEKNDVVQADAKDSTEFETDEGIAVKLDGSQPSDEELKESRKRKGLKSRKSDSKNDAEDSTSQNQSTDAGNGEVIAAAADDDNSINEKKSNDAEEKDSNIEKEDKITEQVQMEVDQIIGETTPKSRNISKQPERRSTTKLKKEVAQKMVLKSSQENRDEMFIDNDSNIGMDANLLEKNVNTDNSVDDGNLQDSDSQVKLSGENDNKKKVTKRTVKEILLGVQDGKLIKELSVTLDKCEKAELTITGSDLIETDKIVETNGNEKQVFVTDNEDVTDIKSEKQTKRKSSDKSSTSTSDDDVPLSQLKKKNMKKIGNTKLAKKEGDLQRSPVSNKLRSNKVVGTRLRSGQMKTKTSPKSKKSVNLALKRTRMRNKQKMNEQLKDKMPVDSSDNEAVDEDKTALEPLVNIEKVEKEFENETENIPEIEDQIENVKNEKGNEEATDKQDELNQQNSIQEVFNSENPADNGGLLNNNKVNNAPANTLKTSNTNETPRKLLEKSKEIGSMLMMNSDSKLVVGSRRFEKRKGFARKSILKPASGSLSSHVGSPKRTDFRPIMVGQIYSPTASPSASILKKRQLDANDSDTNSPPTKQRRVSFATPLIEAGNAPITVDPSKPGSTGIADADSLEKIDTVPFKQSGSQLTQSSCQSSEGSMTQGTYQSTQESQLNSTEPVCPDLVGCEQAVEKILPQLTSSIWSRGLGQLVRARNIKTIGDLSALTENDIQSLPIRSPKVETVRKTLTKFQTLQSKSSRLINAPRVRLETKILAEVCSTYQDEDPLNIPGSSKGKSEIVGENQNGPVVNMDSKLAEKSLDKDINDVLSSSSNLLNEMTRLSQNLSQEMQSGNHKTGVKTEMSDKLVEHCKQFGACLMDNVKTLDKEQLVEVLKTLSNVQISLLGAINM